MITVSFKYKYIQILGIIKTLHLLQFIPLKNEKIGAMCTDFFILIFILKKPFINFAEDAVHFGST